MPVKINVRAGCEFGEPGEPVGLFDAPCGGSAEGIGLPRDLGAEWVRKVS